MSVGCRRNAVVIGSLSLLCSLVLAGWVPQTSGLMGELFSVHFPEGTTVGYAVGAGMDSIGGFGGAGLKTTDGGATWGPMNVGAIPPLSSVYFTDNSNGYAVGAAKTAIRTSDGGTNWTAMTIPGSDIDLTKVQFPENGMTGYIGVHPRGSGATVLKTTDGGANWTSIGVGGLMNTSYSCAMATDNIGVVFGNSGFIVATTDGFGTSPYQGAQTNADLKAAAFHPDDPLKGYLVANDTLNGLVRGTQTGGVPLWDSVRFWPIPAYYGVDATTPDAAYLCGANGRIDRSVEATDFFRTTTPDSTTVIFGLCFPVGEDTGYAVGAAGTIWKTTDKGIPWLPGVAEGRIPTIDRTAIRVVSNPSRHGIALHSDAAVRVTVFDAAGRVVTSQAATKGLNFLPLPTGAYFVKAGAATTRAVVTD